MAAKKNARPVARTKKQNLPGTDTLPPNALAYLRERAVTPAAAKSAGLRYVTETQRRELVGAAPLSDGRDISDGIYIPYPGYGLYTVRMLHPDVKKGKFRFKALEKGTPMPPYCSPLSDWKNAQLDATYDVHLCEGPVKALAMSMHGLTAMAVNGVTGWMLKNSRGELNKRYDEFEWSDRNVILTPDNDTHTNRQVQSGWIKLAERLADRGANVFIRELPEQPDGSKLGPDDFIKRFGFKALQAIEPVSWDDEQFRNWGVHPEVEKMNAHHALLKSGQVRVYIDERGLGHSENYSLLTVADFKIRYGNVRINTGATNKEGRPIFKSVADMWLDSPHRRDILRVDFDPMRPWGLQDGSEIANIWSGFGYTPARPDSTHSWSLLKDHIRENICCGIREHYAYVLGWMAFGVQRLNVPPGVAIVLRGSEGTGKGVLGRAYTSLFGRAGFHATKTKDMIGSFSGHLADKIAIFADEALFSGDQRVNNELKALLTEPSRVIEAKFQNPIIVPNYTRLLIASNENHPIYAGADARRFAAFHVSDEHKSDRAYFDALYRQLNNGGYEAMLYELQHMDISNFDVLKFPRTVELALQKELSLDPLAEMWLTCLRRGWVGPKFTKEMAESAGWREYVLVSEMEEMFQQALSYDRYQMKGLRTRIGIMLKDYAGSGAVIHVRETTGARRWQYRLKSLQFCREQFVAKNGPTDFYEDDEQPREVKNG